MGVFFLLQLFSVVPVKSLVCAGTPASAALSMSVVSSHKLLESSRSIFLPDASEVYNRFSCLMQCSTFETAE